MSSLGIMDFINRNGHEIRNVVRNFNDYRDRMCAPPLTEYEIHNAIESTFRDYSRLHNIDLSSTLEHYLKNVDSIKSPPSKKESEEQRREQQEIDKIKDKMTYKPGQDIMQFVNDCHKYCQDDMRKKWLHTFKNCVLPPRVKDVIQEALTVVLRGNVFDEWGITEHFEKGLTNSILLYGPPGTGKTMIAEAFAAVLDKNLLKVTSADIDSQIPGEGCRNIQKHFKQAKENDAVLMLDECDSLLYDRNAVGMIIGKEINELLQQIERFDGVIILTTNRLGKLDEALQRRIIAKIELPLPGKAERDQIWRNLMPKKMPVVKKLDYKWLASKPLSGGEIKNAILLAARKAIANNAKKVSMPHFKEAVEFVMKSKRDFKQAQPKVIGHAPVQDYSQSDTGISMKMNRKVDLDIKKGAA